MLSILLADGFSFEGVIAHRLVEDDGCWTRLILLEGDGVTSVLVTWVLYHGSPHKVHFCFIFFSALLDCICITSVLSRRVAEIKFFHTSITYDRERAFADLDSLWQVLCLTVAM